MEYRNGFLIVWGILGLLSFCLYYWKVFHKQQLNIAPGSSKTSKIFKTKRLSVFLMGTIGWMLLSYSLLGPRESVSFDESSIEINDIFFVVDVSRSMLAEDFKPNRIEVAKEKIKNFISLRPEDRIGIIMFSEKVFTLLPLTTDLKVVEDVIEQIKIGFLGSGTNIGDALGLAVTRSRESKTKNKVVILLTDGVSNVGSISPLQAAEEAKKNKIKVYTVAVGSDDDAKIPIGNGMFGKAYQTIPGGSIDLSTLEEMSKLTGARSYSAKNPAALEKVLTEIETLEKTKIKVKNNIIYNEKYYLFFLFGFLLILASELAKRFVLRDLL